MSQANTKGNIRAIEGMRGLAVLAVMIYHMEISGLLPGGFTGVDVFFVISGFVISKSLYTEKSLGFAEFVSTFYKKRILRIVPLLSFSILTVLLFTIMFTPVSWKSSMIQKTALSTFLGYSNMNLVWQNDGYFSPMIAYNPFAHTWSLGVEEQFYVLFPLLFFWWNRGVKSKQKINYGLVAIVTLTFVSLINSVLLTNTHPDRAYYFITSRFWEIAIGALLFIWYSKRGGVKRQWIGKILSYIGFILITVGFLFANPSAFPYPWAMITVSGTVLLILSIISQSEGVLVKRFFELNWICQIGKLSFSLYIMHWPIAVLMKWTIGFNTLFIKVLYLIISLLISVLTYYCIENPIRAHKRLRAMNSKPIIITGLIILISSNLLGRLMISNTETLSLSVTKDSYTWLAYGYEFEGPDMPIVIDNQINGKQLFTFGDSHAAAYRTMLNIVCKQLGLVSHVYEKGGCAIVGLIESKSDDSDWETFYLTSLHDIKAKANPGDIVFLPSLRMPELSNRFEPVDVDFVLKDYYSESNALKREQAYQEGCEIIEALIDMDVKVLINAPEPVVMIPPYRCSDWFNKMNPIAEPGSLIDKAILEYARRPVMNSIKKLLARYDELYLWDPMEVLCPTEVFDAYDDEGLPLYYDGDHLTAHGNRKLVPSFREKLIDVFHNKDH